MTDQPDRREEIARRLREVAELDEMILCQSWLYLKALMKAGADAILALEGGQEASVDESARTQARSPDSRSSLDFEAQLAERFADPEWLAKWNAHEEDRIPFGRLLHAMCSEEGETVTLLADNPDFNGQPNNAIECCGSWTHWREVRFTGDTLRGALLAAYRSRFPAGSQPVSRAEGAAGNAGLDEPSLGGQEARARATADALHDLVAALANEGVPQSPRLKVTFAAAYRAAQANMRAAWGAPAPSTDRPKVEGGARALGIALAALQHIQGMEPITHEITLATVMANHAVDALKEIEELGATSCPNPCGECRGVVVAGKCDTCGWEVE